MAVENVHARVLAVGSAAAGRLIDTLGSEADALWPRGRWPAMRFDRPLQIGAKGGHGPIRYTVADYQPGCGVRFVFDSPSGFHGEHGFEVRSLEDGRCSLRHFLRLQPRGVARLSWPLIYRWLHDACVEDALTRAEISLGLRPRARPWCRWVRVLRCLYRLRKG
ncbi:MAG: hypothetical protein JJT90_12875 [Ectothiorhodospiraceae bacterium]|nr:hypothetical protein [Ectothiorhodospiraceae bacterium]